MANKIVLKKSSVAGKTPLTSDLDYGELAINYADGKLYYKKSDNTIDVFTSQTGTAAVISVDGNAGAITSAQLLTAIKKEDGSGSGLDADLLDGYNSSISDAASTVVVRDTSKNISVTGVNISSAGGSRLITWNSTEGTYDMGLDNGVTLQVGQETNFYAKATEAIPNGSLVMFAGAEGDHLLISKANLSAVGFQDTWIVGVATQSFATNDFGYITCFGKVRDLNTIAWTEGTILYADPNTAGALTSTRPSAPTHAIEIAAVVRSHATQGTLLVRPTFGTHLGEIHDVKVTTPSAGEVLAYNASGYWQNVNPLTVSGLSGFSGISGYSGKSGYSGYSGFSGTPGLGFTIAKTYVSVAALTADTSPTGIVAGQFAIIDTGNVENAENSRLYLWNGSSYQYVTDLSGAMGISGTSGYSGATGFSGISGYSGSGISGYSGFSGISGYTGISGYSGFSGISGYSGQNGTIGVNGTSGYSGFSGISGYSGSGVSGYSGFSGISGYSGSTGPSNTINATNDTTTTALYPVMVAAVGSNQTAKASSSKIFFNAATGTIYATSKSFVIPHPIKEGKKLIYGSLEGPENGVYVRGRLQGDTIELPDYWVQLIDPDTISVQLTPIGKHQKLYVEEIKDNKVVIKNDAMFSSQVDCFFTVLAERKDIAKLEVETM